MHIHIHIYMIEAEPRAGRGSCGWTGGYGSWRRGRRMVPTRIGQGKLNFKHWFELLNYLSQPSLSQPSKFIT